MHGRTGLQARVYCGFNVTGVCPVKSGTMPERIMNAVGRPIPLHLYIKCKEDFDKAHEGAPKLLQQNVRLCEALEAR